MRNVHLDHRYDRYLSFGAFAEFIFYCAPAAVLLAAMAFFGVDDRYWTPVLLVYLIGVLALTLGYGFQAVCVQIKATSDHWAERTGQPSDDLD